MQTVWIIILACLVTVISLGITPCRGCGKQFIGRSGYGVLNSPNFPFDYQSNQNCTYEFYVDEYDPQIQTLVCFYFWRFALPMDDPNCERDYLQLDSVDRSRYCGQGYLAASLLQRRATAWPTVWDEQFCWPIQNKMLTLTFTTTSGSRHPGFYATYTVYDVSLGQRSPMDGPTISAEFGHPRTAPCKQDQWTCFNRQCIPRTNLCNLIDDCEDGSDEQYTHARCRVKGFKPARSCDFEMGEHCGFLGLRSWKQVDLSRHLRSSLPKPETDHTVQRPGVGSYLLADFFNRSVGYTAKLHTQFYHHDTNGCVSFWYQLVGKLTIKLADKIVWNRVGNDTHWHRAQLHVPADVRGRFEFEATKMSNNSMVAIDDVYFSDGDCDWDEPSCSFEFDTCGWTNRVYEDVVYGEGQAIWREENHPGKGHVMSLLVDNAPKELLANITSPPLSAFNNQTFCLQLEYNVPYLLESLAVFGIHLLHWDGMLERRPLWSQNATTNMWQEVSVEVNMSRPFQFQLIGYVRLQGSLKVLIDNVSITRGRCSGTNVAAHDRGGSVGPTNLCESDPWACTAGPTCADGDCHPRDPEADIPDDHDEKTRRGKHDEGGDTKDIVSMTSIGLACAVSVVLVLVIGLWVMRMRKRAEERRRQSTRSARTDSSSVADGDDNDEDNDTEAVQGDVPPRYSDAVRQPQRRPELTEMTVWAITATAPSHHSPPPAYDDIVGQPTNQFFPPANVSSGGYSNLAMTRSTYGTDALPQSQSAPDLQFEHAPVHLPRSEASSGVAYTTRPPNTGQFVPSTTRVNVPYSVSPVQITPTSSGSSSHGRRISSSSVSSTNSGVVGYTQQHLPLPPSSIITSDSVRLSNTVIRIENSPTRAPGSRSLSGSSSASA